MAWLVPGIAMALVSLALSIGVTIEHAAIGVVIAWIAAPVGVSRLAADRIAATAGLGQLVAVGAAALAALAITNRRSFLDFRGT